LRIKVKTKTKSKGVVSGKRDVDDSVDRCGSVGGGVEVVVGIWCVEGSCGWSGKRIKRKWGGKK
jgi:hypothetical protein